MIKHWRAVLLTGLLAGCAPAREPVARPVAAAPAASDCLFFEMIPHITRAVIPASYGGPLSVDVAGFQLAGTLFCHAPVSREQVVQAFGREIVDATAREFFDAPSSPDVVMHVGIDAAFRSAAWAEAIVWMNSRALERGDQAQTRVRFEIRASGTLRFVDKQPLLTT